MAQMDKNMEHGSWALMQVYIGFRLGTAPSLSKCWIISIIWLFIALKRTPNIDFY